MANETIVTESRQQFQLRSGQARPRFLQGTFPFIGRGITEHLALGSETDYTVPDGHQAEVLYVRAGNHTGSLIYLTLCANDRPIRYFPLGKNEGANTCFEVSSTIPPTRSK